MLLSMARVINGLLYFHYLIKRMRNLLCYRVYYDRFIPLFLVLIVKYAYSIYRFCNINQF